MSKMIDKWTDEKTGYEFEITSIDAPGGEAWAGITTATPGSKEEKDCLFRRIIQLKRGIN